MREGTGGVRASVVAGVALLAVAALATSVAAMPSESEPNDTRSNAQSISFGEEITGEVATEDDEDWYALDVEAGESVNVTVTGTSGNVYVQLRNASSTLPGGALANEKYVGAGETKHFGGVVNSDTTLYVRVYFQTGSYSFEANRPANDDREYDGTEADATEIQPGQQVSGRVSINDEDWYAVDLDAGDSIRTEVSVPSDSPDRVFVSFRNDSGVVERPGNQVGNGVYVQPGQTQVVGGVVEQSGTHYVRVYYGQGPYTMTVEEVRNDPGDPNERQATAAPLFENPFTPTDGRLSYNDQDWLRVPARAGETLSLDASMRAGATGEVFAELRNETAVVGSESESGPLSGYVRPDEPLSVSGTAGVSGPHYLRVYYGEGTPMETYRYDLRVDGERYGPPNDRFERANPPIGNQDPANATAIDPGQYPDLGMVDDDRDVFAVDLVEGERLRAAVDFSHEESDLALRLADEAGTTLDSADSGTDGERLGFTAPSDGTYYLSVTGEPGSSTTYDLELSVLRKLDVTLGPGGASLPPGTTTTVDVAVSNANAGLGNVTLSLRSTNTSVLTIESADAARTASASTEMAADGGTATVNVTGFDDGVAGTVTVATVTVRSGANGSATLTGNATVTSGGLVYPLNAVQSTSVTVRPGNISTTTPTDPSRTTTTTAAVTGTESGNDDGTDSSSAGEAGTDAPETTASGGGPGFGAVVALLGLSGCVLLALRRSKRP